MGLNVKFHIHLAISVNVCYCLPMIAYFNIGNSVRHDVREMFMHRPAGSILIIDLFLQLDVR